jgi:hypothetical protein
VQSGPAVLALSIDLSAGIKQHFGNCDASRQWALRGIPKRCVAAVAVFGAFANKVNIHARFEFLNNSRYVAHPCCGVDWRKVFRFNGPPRGVCGVFHVKKPPEQESTKLSTRTLSPYLWSLE